MLREGVSDTGRKAMKHGFLITVASLGVIMGSVVLSGQAYAKQPVAISIIGNGPAGGSTNISCTNSDDALCPTSDTCWCNTANGSAKTALAGLGGATFSADTVIITNSSGPYFIGNCNSAQGHVTITSGNSKNSLVLRYAGIACFYDGGILDGEPVTITMTYTVDPGVSTGKFAGATGTGSITGSEDPGTGNILGTVTGNILLAK